MAGAIIGGSASQDTAEQIEEFINSLGGVPAIAPLLALVTDGYGTPAVASPVTLTSGTPYVNSTTKKQTLRVAITGGSAGTIGIVLTDLTPANHTLVPVVAANAVASQVFDVPVPAGWSVTVTTSVATINANTSVTTGF